MGSFNIKNRPVNREDDSQLSPEKPLRVTNRYTSNFGDLIE